MCGHLRIPKDLISKYFYSLLNIRCYSEIYILQMKLLPFSRDPKHESGTLWSTYSMFVTHVWNTKVYQSCF